MYGVGSDYEVTPFKGLYLHSPDEIGSLRTHVYPVPNLLNPFLGVHFTILVDGTIEIGPTAIPAFWREHYSGLDRFSFTEAIKIIFRELDLFIENPFNFRRLALQEVLKYNKNLMVKHASELIIDNKPSKMWKWGVPGIRAQLYNKKDKKLEMDFIIQKSSNSIHILNAVSPAFTCAIPFARYVVNKTM